MLFTFSEVQDLDKCFVAGVFVVVPLRCKCKDSQFYNCFNNFGREIPSTPPDILNGVSSSFQHLQFNGTLFIVNGSEILDLIWEGGVNLQIISSFYAFTVLQGFLFSQGLTKFYKTEGY